MPEGPSRWPAWLRWLRPPALPDPDQTERAAFLHVMMVATTVVVVGAFAFARFEPVDLKAGLPLGLAVVGVNVAGLAALRRGRVRIVGLAYCSLIVLVLAASQVMFGANAVMLASGMINITFVAGFAVGTAAALAFGLMSAAWIGSTMWLTALGMLPPAPYAQRPIDTGVQAGAPLVVTAILIAYGLMRLRATAREARAGQEANLARAREGALIGDLGQRVVQVPDPDRFVEDVVTTVQKELGLDSVAVYQHGVGCMRVAGQAGPVSVPEEIRLSGDSGEICTEASREARPIPLDAAALQAFGDIVVGPDARGVRIAIPRHTARGGCLLALTERPERLQEAQVALLRTCATLLGAAADRGETEAQLRQAQKMEAVGQLAGGVAHDFNNLLTGIMGSAELASLGVDANHPIAPLLEDISRAGEHAALLTRQLLVFSRKDKLRPEVVDVREVVAGLNRILARLMGEHVELVTPEPGEAARVFADRSALEQIILNLCLNARDAVGKTGTITIDVSTEHSEPQPDSADDSVVLGVADDGCGMDAATREHMFEPFFTTKGPEQGTGLGLATVDALVREFGGEVGVESREGEGTRFAIRFPRAPVESADVARNGPGRGPAGHGEVVLLVEDHDLARRALERTLQCNGYQVLLANHGAEALEVLGAHHEVAIIVSDISMPKMSGDEMLLVLRRRGQHTPVVFLSGYPSANDRPGRPVTTLDAPLLAKPVATEDLLRTIRAELDQARAATPAAKSAS